MCLRPRHAADMTSKWKITPQSPSINTVLFGSDPEFWLQEPVALQFGIDGSVQLVRWFNVSHEISFVRRLCSRSAQPYGTLHVMLVAERGFEWTEWSPSNNWFLPQIKGKLWIVTMFTVHPDHLHRNDGWQQWHFSKGYSISVMQDMDEVIKEVALHMEMIRYTDNPLHLLYHDRMTTLEETASKKVGAVGVGAVGAVGAVLMKKNEMLIKDRRILPPSDLTRKECQHLQQVVPRVLGQIVMRICKNYYTELASHLETIRQMVATELKRFKKIVGNKLTGDMLNSEALTDTITDVFLVTLNSIMQSSNPEEFDYTKLPCHNTINSIYQMKRDEIRFAAFRFNCQQHLRNLSHSHQDLRSLECPRRWWYARWSMQYSLALSANDSKVVEQVGRLISIGDLEESENLTHIHPLFMSREAYLAYMRSVAHAYKLAYGIEIDKEIFSIPDGTDRIQKSTFWRKTKFWRARHCVKQIQTALTNDLQSPSAIPEVPSPESLVPVVPTPTEQTEQTRRDRYYSHLTSSMEEEKARELARKERAAKMRIDNMEKQEKPYTVTMSQTCKEKTTGRKRTTKEQLVHDEYVSDDARVRRQVAFEAKQAREHTEAVARNLRDKEASLKKLIVEMGKAEAAASHYVPTVGTLNTAIEIAMKTVSLE